MEKEKSPAAWIMQWAGKQKILYALSIGLAVFNVLFKLIPFFIIGDVINRLINGEKGLKAYLIEIAMIAGSFVIAEIFHSVSTAFSHKATFSVLGQIRKKPATSSLVCRSDMLKTPHRVLLKKLWQSGLTA